MMMSDAEIAALELDDAQLAKVYGGMEDQQRACAEQAQYEDSMAM